MPKDKTGDAAFTLTEVVISAVLMLLALGLLLSAFVSSKRSVALSQARLSALQIACNAAEQIQTNAYSNIVSSTAISTIASIQYTMSNSVTTNTLDTYRAITITIQWTDPASSRSQMLTNYMMICNTN